jgi:hypothetical protein
MSAPSAADADSGSIVIELNKIEETDEGCRTLFVFDNRSGHELNPFRVDLVLFDTSGVVSHQFLLEAAPLYAGKKTVASFVIKPGGCKDISSILVNDIPRCENDSGAAFDCVERLEVSSKSEIPLEK